MANRRDAERQVDELQTLVAALNAQIQGMQAKLEVREKEVRDLSAKVEEYRSRESAIVIAMTDTQEACKRRISDAERQAQNIITNANEQSRLTLTEAKARMSELEKKARLIEESAYRKADDIVAQSNEAAAKRSEQAALEASEFKARLGKLKCELKRAAEQARSNANSYAASLEDSMAEIEQLESDSLELLPDAVAGFEEPLPDFAPSDEGEQKEYDNAALFIRDMYKLEGRGMPGADSNNDEDEDDSQDENRVWTVDEIIAYQSRTREAQAQMPEEPYVEPEPEPKATDVPGVHWTGPTAAEAKDPFKRNSIFPDLFEDDKDNDKSGDPIDIDSLLDEIMD